MLRPSNSLLGSSRAARRGVARAAVYRFVQQAARRVRALVAGTVGTAVELVLLCGLPLFYLVAAYLVLDVPARWLSHRSAPGGAWTALLFGGAVIVSLSGFSRAAQNAAPIAPVRPRFAKAMFGLSWVAAFLLVLGDLAS